MARLNVLLTGYDITDEVIERTSSTALALGHDTIRGTADLEIWTGAGGTGTQLALTTDYTVSDEDTDLSTEAGVSIYTKLAIVNGTYHNVDLYATYKTIGDYASAETVRAFDAEYTEVTGNYTVLETDRYLKITTASAITITIPDTMPDNWPLTFSRPISSANAVTAARSGTELIEGETSFVVIGAKAAAAYDPSETTLRKVASGAWRFVAGEIRGFVAGKGHWFMFPSGTLSQDANYTGRDLGNTTAYGTGRYIAASWIFPKPFANIDYSISAYIRTTASLDVGSLSDNYTTEEVTINFFDPSSTSTVNKTTVYEKWFAYGRWRSA